MEHAVKGNAPYATFNQPQAGRAQSYFLPQKRLRINLVAICVNMAAPWIAFCVVYGAMSFASNRALAYLLAAGCAKLAAVAGYTAYRYKQQNADPTWLAFLCLTLLVATLSGYVLGDMNFHNNLEHITKVNRLNTYPTVNPAREKGQQMMDAGKVYFEKGVTLDLKKAFSFKKTDTYCVAPITSGTGTLPAYDFWAVGINCCSGTEFKCGQFNNPMARAGVRVLRESDVANYKLAVTQAQAAYSIKSAHPLFFHWMQDPLAEMSLLRKEAFKYYLLGIFAYFAFAVVTVGAAVVGFSKMA